MADNEEILDYEEEDVQEEPQAQAVADQGKKGYVGVHSSGFKDFLLKPELVRAITDCGFEHPSQVQHECIPNAMAGMDILCQAKSGMGKTAVFVLAILQQLDPKEGEVSALVLCHTRELAYQICAEFDRFAKHMPNVKTANFFGGLPIQTNVQLLKTACPNIVVGTPGRIKQLGKQKDLNLTHLRHFVLDECDKVLEKLDMRGDVQDIFKMTPPTKQVMMFTATLQDDMRKTCKRFMNEPLEVIVDDQSKLTLHGLVQHYVMLLEAEKNRKLNDLLDMLDFNQVVIFVKSLARARELNRLLNECNFPSVCIYSSMGQPERIAVYKEFKEGKKRILVATDLVGRGIDIEKVNVVINYDMPETDERHGDGTDTYLHRVGRAGRFGTKGLAITFVASKEDSAVLSAVQDRFDVEITKLPDNIDRASYISDA